MSISPSIPVVILGPPILDNSQGSAAALSGSNVPLCIHGLLNKPSLLTDMQLFNQYSFDLSGFRGRLKRDLGTYKQHEQIAKAQARLYDEVIHTDQVVWCSLEKPESVTLQQPQFIHTIEADKRDIAAILYGFVWEHIIGRKCVPPEEHERMRNSCCANEPGSRHQALEDLVNQYIAKHLPRDPWSNVLAPGLTCRMPQILLGWPFQHSRIVQVKTIPGLGGPG